MLRCLLAANERAMLLISSYLLLKDKLLTEICRLASSQADSTARVGYRFVSVPVIDNWK